MPILSGARPARLPAISLLSKFRARGRVRSRELRNAGEIRLCGYGGDNHVVAEAELRPGERVLVDSQNPPHVRDLEPLDEVILILEHTENFSDMACTVNRSLRCPICRGALVSARSSSRASSGLINCWPRRV